jgi:riboflavin kinase, archaea type
MPSKPKPRAESLTTILHLVKLGAGASFAGISSAELGSSMGLSQQAASLRLIGLEKAGLVERAHLGRGLAVRLTARGLKEATDFLSETGGGLGKDASEMTFTGAVFTGLNEGRYYVSLKGYSRAFANTLGFVPYPGTLNLRLAGGPMIEQRRYLDRVRGVEVPGFADGRRSYGPVKCFRARVGGKQPGAVLAIERTHYDSTVLEVIAPVNLRKELSLRDGDECTVTAYL